MGFRASVIGIKKGTAVVIKKSDGVHAGPLKEDTYFLKSEITDQFEDLRTMKHNIAFKRDGVTYLFRLSQNDFINNSLL